MVRKLTIISAAAVLVCIVIAASAGITQLQSGRAGERLATQRRAITRAAVLCYALEGAYPPDVNYLEEHYGLVVDHEQFIIHYRAYGSNLRPEIEVYRYG